MALSASERGLVVVVVGATGAVGKDLVQALDKAPFPVRELRLAASGRSADAEVSFRGESLPVHALGPRVGQDAVFRGADLVFFATPPGPARDAAPLLVEQGTVLIDIGGTLADQAPVFLPPLGLDLDRFDRARVVSTPWAPVAALATLLAPLGQLGLHSARGLALLSAGLSGKAGVDELSAQVIAMFNAGSPPRKVFPGGLAFDLAEPPGVRHDANGWNEAELRLAVDTARLLGLEPGRVAVSVMMAPLFAGLALSLHLRFDADWTVAQVRSALETAEGVRFGDPTPGPRRLPGRSGLYVGRLRPDLGGDGFHVWATADNLRFGATAPALSAAHLLWREGRLGQE